MYKWSTWYCIKCYLYNYKVLIEPYTFYCNICNKSIKSINKILIGY